jgi:hypothetical protein
MGEFGLHNESSMSEGEDTDFVMRKCGVCQERAIGKSMYDCPECRLPICQSCHTEYMGCLHDEPDPVCSKCIAANHNGKRKYCPKRGCDCDNPSPRREKAIKSKLALTSDIDDAFRKFFDAKSWKESHPPINYPGKHTGKFLIDLFLSRDSFEHGYLYWLVNKATQRPAGQTDEAYVNFQKYRDEAREILAIFEASKRKLNAKRVYNLRDRSPQRK